VLEMSDRDKFLFDVQGFLVVPGVLSEDEVERLNAAVDANRDRIRDDRNAHTDGSQTLAGSGKRRTLNDLLTLEQPWCQPFRDLLVHPKLVPYLNTMLGPGWRMDHAPQMFFAEPGAEGLALHGAGAGVAEIWDRDHPGFGGQAPDLARTYQYANGQMRCGLLSIEFHLSPNEEGHGGFAAIPGSHKANFPMPEQIRKWEDARDAVRNPACAAGDALIFNEALLHGTLPWREPHERRALLYRYSPRYLHYAGGYNRTELPSWASELTEPQRAVLEPPYVYARPVISDDGLEAKIESGFGKSRTERERAV